MCSWILEWIKSGGVITSSSSFLVWLIYLPERSYLNGLSSRPLYQILWKDDTFPRWLFFFFMGISPDQTSALKTGRGGEEGRWVGINVCMKLVLFFNWPKLIETSLLSCFEGNFNEFCITNVLKIELKPLQMLKYSMQLALRERKHCLLPKLISSGFIQGEKIRNKVQRSCTMALKYVDHTYSRLKLCPVTIYGWSCKLYDAKAWKWPLGPFGSRGDTWNFISLLP